VSASRGTIAGLIAALAITGCFLRASGRTLTGTCTGACDHYLSCKRSGDKAARGQCLTECSEVFSDERSLKEFEKLSCRDAVEYVDGTPTRVSERR